MSDIHVLAGDGKQLWTIVMHFAVPNVNNSVAVNYRTALVNSGLGGATSMVEGTGPGEIATAEKASIETGALYERLVSFLAESGGSSNLELQASLRQLYTREKAATIANLQKKLRYYGHTESEA